MLMTIIFAVLMFTVFGKLLFLAFRAAWGITRILFSIVLLPLALIGMFMAGLVYVAIPLLVIIGIIALATSV